MLPISRILEKKLRLYVKKVSLISKVFAEKPHYIYTYKDLNALRIIISKEIALNKRLLYHIKVYSESKRNHLEPVVVKFEEVTRKLIIVLRLERKVLRRIGLHKIVLHEASLLLFRKPQGRHFDLPFSHFKELYKREQELDAHLFMIVSHKKDDIIATKVKMYQGIAKDINTYSKAMLNSVGNSELIRKNAREILKIVNRVQNTELYAYMREDLSFVKNQIHGVIKDPNKSRVKTLLATIYILAPGTFETTAYLLLVKNLTRLTVNKIKRRRFNPPRVS